MKKIILKFLKNKGYQLQKIQHINPEKEFNSFWYIRHNYRRLEALSLIWEQLFPKSQQMEISVLELGAGIGDFSSFFIDRNIPIHITEAREENIAILNKRFPSALISKLDIENPLPIQKSYPVVFSFGLLYHLGNPKEAIAYMANSCSKVLILETCIHPTISYGWNIINEDKNNPTQSFSGKGCLPGLNTLIEELKIHFDEVEISDYQPHHPEFIAGKSSLYRKVITCKKLT